ncbi:MATE family efflux transporter [Undibacterium sp. LX40W]|uniref:MATE family efflux transporter n=1 Tax=Undibacterium nitidum TaxID=2762298 RepID=A0A923HQU4_9BURK|nr:MULTISPECIES: MATE family efflux transporter [Undibacterium]MBC3880792.1 MATE family efflux transporter [Undibacterium nitidum]MBC3890475.1 MATE family efflux transporter [Undibacterium sp. LX40W]
MSANPAPLTEKLQKLGLFAITWPIFIEQLSHILPGMIDIFMISHLGDAAAAGVSVANQIVVFFIVLFSFIGLGSSVVITHYLGAQDKQGAERVASNAIGVNVWLGAAISILTLLFSNQMLTLLHLPNELLPYARPFLALMGGTLFLEAINIVFASILRAHGHTREVMVIALGMNLINIALNSILIFGLFGLTPLGVVGAALSTVISRLIACVAYVYLVKRLIQLPLRFEALWNFSRSIIAKILHIGIPSAGENLCWWTSFMVITYFIAQMGADQIATFTYAMQLSMIMMMLSIAIGIGTEIIIGHLIGAGELDLAYRQLLRSLRVGVALTVVMTVVVVFAGKPLFSLFSQKPEIIEAGASLLLVSLILEPGRTFNLVVINSLRATGDARFPLYAGIVSMWGIAVVLAWLLGLHWGWGLIGVWSAFAIDEWVRGLLMYRRWKSRAWEKHAHATRAGLQQN